MAIGAVLSWDDRGCEAKDRLSRKAPIWWADYVVEVVGERSGFGLVRRTCR
jgi:hypothetical protein